MLARAYFVGAISSATPIGLRNETARSDPCLGIARFESRKLASCGWASA